MRLFFFGTLLDAELRQAVIGRALPAEPAVVRGFRRVVVAGRGYPMLVAAAGGRVDGIVVGGLDPEAIRRLHAYEGGEYALRPIRVRTGAGPVLPALAFRCRAGVVPGRAEWRFERWQRRHKRSVLRRAALRRWA